MKRHYSLFVICVFILSLSLLSLNSYAGEVRIENVQIDKAHSNAWAVKGMVRNLENHSIEGYVKIKFLNAQGDIVKSALTYVNAGDPLNPGQAGPFEYWTEPENFTGVVNFQVLFRDK